MDRLGIRRPQRVADIGAGLGYYTVRLAGRLGSGATIYATDVTAEYLDRLRARLEREGIRSVTLILGLPRDPRLPPRSVDVVILSHVYHEIENPYEFLYRLQPSLAPGARVGIIDMDRPTPGPWHPTDAPSLRTGRGRLPAARFRLAGPRRRLSGRFHPARDSAAGRGDPTLPAAAAGPASSHGFKAMGKP
jgi:SAM-dependent methyltransferase